MGSRTPEGKFKIKIRQQLKQLAAEFDGRLYFKANPGSVFGGATSVDFDGCVDGHYFAIEVKRPDGRGKLSGRQRLTLSEVERAGGSAYLVDSEVALAHLICVLRDLLKYPQ